MQKRVVQFLKIFIAVGLILWLVESGRLDFRSLTKLLSFKYLLPCFLCMGLNLLTGCARWRILLRAQNIFMKFKDVFKLILIGTFFNFAMPGGVGGDVIRGFYIAKHNHQAKTDSVVSVIMDRLVGLYSMVFMAVLAMLLFLKESIRNDELKIVLFLLTSFFVAFSFFWLIFFSKRLYKKLPFKEKFSKIYQSFSNFRQHRSIFLKSLLLSLVSQIFSISFFVFAGHGLGYSEVPVSVYFFVVPLGFMIATLPLSIAGIGVGQAAFLFLFDMALNTESQIGPSTITAYQIFLFIFGLSGAYFYLKNPKREL